jgi:NADPH:quinone reductase-like Zn-dependent oxidoreductase
MVTSEHLARISGLLDGGEIKTRVGAILLLADARVAHLMLEGVWPRPKGKIVLAVGTT